MTELDDTYTRLSANNFKPYILRIRLCIVLNQSPRQKKLRSSENPGRNINTNSIDIRVKDFKDKTCLYIDISVPADETYEI